MGVRGYFGLALAGVVASGCVSLDPTYRRPPPPVPAAFPGGPAYPALSAQAPALAGWRDFFVDPKLRAVVEQALANNRDLRIAIANIQAARAQYHVQRASLFPSLDAQAGATISQTPLSALGVPLGAGAGSSFTEHVYSLSAGVSSYELDLFGRLRSLTRAAFDQYLATDQARRTVQISLIAEVANDYLTLAADRTLLKTAQDTMASGATALGLTRSRFDAGVASQLDVSQAETIVEQARSDVARYTAQVAQDKNALDLAVGAPVDDALSPAGIEPPPALLETLPAMGSEVLLQRPDVLEAEDQLKAANANIGAARAAFLPKVTLTGSGGVSSSALSTLFQGASGAWSFAPTITQPIFDAGQNLANLDYAKAEHAADVAQYEKAIQTAFREVADALAVRGQIGEQIAAQQALVDSNAVSLRLSDARYQRGADTYLNVLIAQRALYAAQQGLASAELAGSINLVNLYKALGGGLN
jgi:multidrug efflux system outer membrane protein